MLRMTKQADYGIVLLTHMASQTGKRFAAPELATATHLPLPTVSKILKLLGKEGLLTSHRGVKGGYSLSHDPQDISIATMITALEGPISFTECIPDTPGVCSQEHICRLRSHWLVINDVLRNALEQVSLAELCNPISPHFFQRKTTEDTAFT